MAHQGTTKADPSDEYPARARDLVFDQISKLSRPHEQLERLMVVINMPTQYRLPNTVLPFGRATSIVEWAMGEGGCGLEALKVAIEDLIAQQGTFPNSRQAPPEATDRLLHEKTGSPPKGLFKNRRAVAIPV